MRKLIVAVLLLVITSGNAFAILPALGIGLGALFAGAAHLAGVYYYMKQASTDSHVVDANGNIYRKSAVQWVDLTKDIPPKPVVVTKDITTTPISIADVRDKVNADKSKYPLLNNALVGPAEAMKDGARYPAGSRVNGSYKNGQLYDELVSSVSDGLMDQSSPVAPSTRDWIDTAGHHRVMTYKGAGQNPTTGKYMFYTYDHSLIDDPNPVGVPVSGNQFAKTLSNNPNPPVGSTIPITSAYQDEIDKMLNDPSYVPTFTDDTTGLPYAPPAGLPSQAQLEAADKAVVAAAAAEAANTQALATATAAAAAADVAASSAAAAAAASPGDPVLAQKAADAAAAAGAAHATADGLAAQQATQAAQEAKDDSMPFTGTVDPSAYGGGQSFDFGARFQSFISAMKATALFSIPGQFLSNVPSGGSSTISFDGGRYGFHTFDFASLSAVFLAVRGLVMVCFTWLAVKIVTLKGGSA